MIPETSHLHHRRGKSIENVLVTASSMFHPNDQSFNLPPHSSTCLIKLFMAFSSLSLKVGASFRSWLLAFFFLGTFRLLASKSPTFRFFGETTVVDVPFGFEFFASSAKFGSIVPSSSPTSFRCCFASFVLLPLQRVTNHR